MSVQWQPRCAIVTGASSGIGRGVAVALSRSGVTVIAVARREERLRTLAAETHGRIVPLALDVTNEAAIAALPTCLLEHQLTPDVLINNAGYACIGPVEDVTLTDVRRQLETNLIAPIALIQALLPAMRAAGRGRIVNVSSVSGLIGLPFMGVYSASKFALEGLSDALRLELAPFGIDVVLVEPAAIASDFGATANAETSQMHLRTDAYSRLFRPAELLAKNNARAAPLDVAIDAVVAAVSAQQAPARSIVPARGRRLVGLQRLLPQRAFDAIVRRQFGLPKSRSEIVWRG